ncbi:MAG: hypothetical protein MUF35_01490 [Candidatus Nanopelagicales bacterium]|jgi:hypothetical protein|nr:hypothetical protein [Candidatus Nanopelagicales bacterium]
MAGKRRARLVGSAAGAALVLGSVAPAAVAAPTPAAPAVAAAAVQGAVVGAGNPTPAEEQPTLKGLELRGGCPKLSPPLQDAILRPRFDNLWLPLRFISTKDGQPLPAWILPAEVVGEGAGLKTRHFDGTGSYTRPYGIPSLRPQTCAFDGTSDEGDFHVVIVGTVLAPTWLLGS